MPDPNHIILRDKRVIFVCIAKSANTSIKSAVWEWLTGERPDNPQRLPFEYGPVRAQWFTVAFVRNPYDRLLSCYADKIHRQWIDSLARFGMSKGMSVQAFVDRVCATPDWTAQGSGQHFRSQWFDLKEMGNGFLGKVEDMEDDWNALRSLSGFSGLPDLERRNATPHSYSLTPSQKAQVYARYRQDFEEFGYER